MVLCEYLLRRHSNLNCAALGNADLSTWPSYSIGAIDMCVRHMNEVQTSQNSKAVEMKIYPEAKPSIIYHIGKDRDLCVSVYRTILSQLDLVGNQGYRFVQVRRKIR